MSEENTQCKKPTTGKEEMEQEIAKKLAERSRSIEGRHPPATKSSPTSVILCI